MDSIKDIPPVLLALIGLGGPVAVIAFGLVLIGIFYKGPNAREKEGTDVITE